MKLTEPQKRVLKAMYENDDSIFVSTWGGKWGISSLRAAKGRRFRPRRKTLEILEKRELLYRGSSWSFSDFEYILTPKGREAAKALQNADPSV